MFWPISTLPVKTVTRAVLVDVEPGGEVLRELAAAARAAGLLGRRRRRRRGEADERCRRRRAGGSARRSSVEPVERPGPRAARAPGRAPADRRPACTARLIVSGAHFALFASVFAAACTAVEDPRIGPAAADVAARARPTMSSALGLGFDLQQRDRRDDHPGRAVAALERLGLEERGLDGMEAAVLREALDRDDLLARGLGDRRLAGRRRLRRRAAPCTRRTGPRRTRTSCRSGRAGCGGPRGASRRAGRRRGAACR